MKKKLPISHKQSSEEDIFPHLPGSHLKLSNPALEFVKTICEVCCLFNKRRNAGYLLSRRQVLCGRCFSVYYDLYSHTILSSYFIDTVRYTNCLKVKNVSFLFFTTDFFAVSDMIQKQQCVAYIILLIAYRRVLLCLIFS